MSTKVINRVSCYNLDSDSIQLEQIVTKKTSPDVKKTAPDNKIIINIDSALSRGGRLDYKSVHEIIDNHMMRVGKTATSNKIPDGNHGFISVPLEIWSNEKIQNSCDVIKCFCLQCLYACVIGEERNMCTYHGVTEYGKRNGYATYSDGIPMNLYIYRFLGGKIGQIYRSDENGILNRVPYRSKYDDITDKPLLIANPIAYSTRGEDIFKNIIFKNVGTFKGSNDEASVASSTKDTKKYDIVIKQELPSHDDFPILGSKKTPVTVETKKSYRAIVDDEKVPTEFKQVTAEKAQLIGKTVDISEDSHSDDNESHEEMSAVSLEQSAHNSVADVTDIETLKHQLELTKLRAEKAELEARLVRAEKATKFSQNEVEELEKAIEEESINSSVSHTSQVQMDQMQFQMQFQSQFVPGFMTCDTFGNQRFVPYQQMCYPQSHPVSVAPPLDVTKCGNNNA